MKYIKLITYALAVLLLLTFITGSDTFAQLKIGLINTDMIMTNYSEMAEVQKQVDEITQKKRKELEDLQNEFATKSKQFESQSLLLSEERKKQMQKELEDLYRKTMQYQQEAFGQGGEIEKKYRELTDPIIKKINDMIDKVSSDENFDLVFDIVNMGVLYANPGKTEDLTQKVLDDLAKLAPKSQVQR